LHGAADWRYRVVPNCCREVQIVELSLPLVVLSAYLLGSFSSAVQIGRWVYGIDIRECGSGNAGTSNVLRTCGWRPAVAVFCVDVGKGGLACAVVPFVACAPSAPAVLTLQVVAAVAAVVGHCYPLFAGFRGGKGVATALGAFLVIDPIAAAAAGVVFLLVVVFGRRVSVGSVAAGLAMPGVLVWARGGLEDPAPPSVVYGAIALAIFITFTHRSNLFRLWHGREPRLHIAARRR
jgi:glycerol-3-phosphate acyltransferase PlsY